MSDKVILDPQTSGNNNIVKLTDALGNPNYFVRSFKQGAEVLIPLADVIKYVDDSTKELMLNTIGGRTYKTTKIGNQIWLAENLDFKFYGLKVGTEETTSGEPHAAYYDNDEATYGVKGNKYGLLYNGYAVEFLNKYKDQLIPGWHVPTVTEWDALATVVGGRSVAGLKLKSKTGWSSGAGTDDFGFTAFPAGSRLSQGNFANLGSIAPFWTADEYSTTNLYYNRFISSSKSMLQSDNNKRGGYAIRLVRDA